ncbi:MULTISPECIES: M23 family metallopeptidase [Caproicibacterium]|jgi:murein DD-endopeptidase MepM/ murein hydrolase activator NlpD|uniref:M23 family metallopeptidase n=1 Tax=Caproicibacterium argilliputei TaxID=3030016 RepID=A0AA97D9U4_9FIRM|nr:M23 family metallopeptidase [Caproicibacterium argilliputei]MDD3230251.1 M23 family metallopeptidase [Oscillospiraceae bacterium]WOC32107.1 M23 family metallopeptidase [Caproicibacterium argilliputei]
MADPATIALAVKTAIAAASDKRTWKAVGVLIAAVLTPFILIIVMIMSLLSGTAQHNDSAVDLVFNGGSISAQVPAEYRQYIEDMRSSFSVLDGAVSEITPQIESGGIDATRVKSIFYSLYFGAENLRMDKNDYRKFTDAFIRYEKRTRTVTDKDGNKTQEAYTVAVPISDLNEIYANLESALGRTITNENKVNAAQIYSRVLYGHSLPENENIGEDEWKKGVGTDGPYTGGGNFASPLGANWRGMVTSEFGWRPNPFGGSGGEGHSGLDLGAPKGTPIHAARDGVVSSVIDSGSSGYGYHVVIDHGDGMVTLYGHCSKVYVRSGQAVKQGDVIAAVGSTGRSTGNHLHFEIRINGKAVNPRNYLP